MTAIFIKTFGCSLNLSDSEVMAGLLQEAGFRITRRIEDAQCIIINTCTVKGPSLSNFLKYLDTAKQSGKPVIAAGCVPKTTPELIEDCSMIGPKQIHRIVEVVEEAINSSPITVLVDEESQRLNLPKIRKNKAVEIIPICSGCLGSCTYCIVKKARGNLASYPKEEIVKQAAAAVKEGAKEIWLTAQDTGCYGMDLKESINLPKLVKEIAGIRGEFFIRIGMANPDHMKGFLDEMIDVLRHPKVFKFIHIPVQSGSDEILESMGRKYKAGDFIDIVKRLRASIPQITISTDIICGFPGETWDQFMLSVELIKKTKPPVLHISRFWPRPGTIAEGMEQVTGGEIKRRSSFLASQFDWIAFQSNKQWEGWKGDVLIDEAGKENTWVGRNAYYKPVILEGNYRIGQTVYVKVNNTTKHDLRAEEAEKRIIAWKS